MARYHFHLWDGKASIPDTEGAELVDVAAIEARALLVARDLLAEEVRLGRLPLGMRLDVEDARRRVVFKLDFKDAVTIVR